MEQSASLLFTAMNTRLGLGHLATHLLRLALEALTQGGRSRLARVVMRQTLVRRIV